MIQILVSACLTGENCKWDGGNNRNEALLDFMERMKGKAEFHPVCPEQLGGLSTPRPASEVRENDGVVVNTEDRNVTAEFLLGADLALREAKKYGCTIAILKEKSPSCGCSGIYNGSFSHTLIPGMGKTRGPFIRIWDPGGGRIPDRRAGKGAAIATGLPGGSSHTFWPEDGSSPRWRSLKTWTGCGLRPA